MQPPFLLAFRARLAKRGYTSIHIFVLHYQDKPDNYLVEAIEPLAGIGVQRVMSLEEVCRGFRF